MQVEVEISLTRSPRISDFGEILSAVSSLATNKEQLSIQTILDPPAIRVAFTIPNSNQAPAADMVSRAIKFEVSHYCDISIAFPKKTKPQEKNVPTAKQEEYLAFIEGYTKIHRKSPSQTEMQYYFRVTPPTVHQMVLHLEKCGFISRVPGEARSLKVIRKAD